MYVCIYVCIYVCLYVYTYVYMYVCVYIMYVWKYLRISEMRDRDERFLIVQLCIDSLNCTLYGYI